LRNDTFPIDPDFASPHAESDITGVVRLSAHATQASQRCSSGRRFKAWCPDGLLMEMERRGHYAMRENAEKLARLLRWRLKAF